MQSIGSSRRPPLKECFSFSPPLNLHSTSAAPPLSPKHRQPRTAQAVSVGRGAQDGGTLDGVVLEDVNELLIHIQFPAEVTRVNMDIKQFQIPRFNAPAPMSTHVFCSLGATCFLWRAGSRSRPKRWERSEVTYIALYITESIILYI